jgi:Protein of unknown function (DUF3071)
MEDLRLVGLSADGSRLVLKNAAGESLALPLDERVHAALRGDRSRLGQLQINIEGKLRPREIQARIRAGQTAEQVAESGGLTVDNVRRFEAPILLERVHMAETAQAVGVRRVTDSVTTPLGALVQSRLDEHGVDPEGLEWDSWRREDGRWQVSLQYSAAGRARAAAWTFDPQRRSLEPADDEARWLTDEERAAPPPAKKSGPRLSAVPAHEPEPEVGRHDTVPVGEKQVGEADDAVVEPTPRPPVGPPARSRSGGRRASIPSWDEILFGSGPKRDAD